MIMHITSGMLTAALITTIVKVTADYKTAKSNNDKKIGFVQDFLISHYID